MHEFQGREIFESVAEMVNPKHTVVMVHDMQNDFLHDDGVFKKAGESIDVSGFLGNLVEFVAKARSHGVRVWQTNFTSLPNLGAYDDPLVNKRWHLVGDPAKHQYANPTILGTWGCQTIDELQGPGRRHSNQQVPHQHLRAFDFRTHTSKPRDKDVHLDRRGNGGRHPADGMDGDSAGLFPGDTEGPWSGRGWGSCTTTR